MTVQQIIDSKEFEVISVGESTEVEIQDIFCCDLLSIAMSKAPAGGVWVTVMANVNTLAVASLTETAMIVLAEGVKLDEETKQKAQTQKITVLATTESTYHTARQLDRMLHENNLL